MKNQFKVQHLCFLTFGFLLYFQYGISHEELPVVTIQDVTDVPGVSERDHGKLILNQNTPFDYPEFTAPEYDQYRGNYEVADVPIPRGEDILGYVSDPQDVLSSYAEQQINQMLYELEQKTTVEVAVVVLPGINDESPKLFAVDLFEEWGIGKADTDNGLLILTVMDQRRTEFEVGYGLEGILTDGICYRIGIQEVVPNFKNGDYGTGMIMAVKRVKEFIENPSVIEEIYSSQVSYETKKTSPLFIYFLVYLFVCLLFGLWFYGVMHGIERSKEDYYDKYHRLEKLKFGCLQILMPFPFLVLTQWIKKRLKRYRYAPRFSKVNGKPLILKNEWAENKFLEAAQNLEEKLDSVRYDVWVSEDESDIMILEYEAPNGRKYVDCRECGYKTYGKTKSRVTKAPTYDHEGERIDYYECRNCNYQESKTVELAQISRSTSSSSSSSSSSGSSFSSSSSSSRSSSSSFGGGSSGGGGAGVSW
ncbi:TPM domain-containing protein [Maribacter luteus]|uniref:TPM domain-containing protein n=1 Tax=Maribacter luteus TaxID=2594478 RepID=UPI002491C5C3|nr:TPM domain-containing protein [Maribacter luteus]